MSNVNILSNKWGRPVVGIKPTKNPSTWPRPNVYEPDGIIQSINCGSASSTGTLYWKWQVNDATTTISYSGGNGGSYAGQTVSSTGVYGLTATLQPGFFLSGDGTLTYTITGTPTGFGIASFNIQLGGQSCTFTRPVTRKLETI